MPACHASAPARPRPLPIMVGYLLWFVFVIAWNVTDRRTPTIATAGAQRARPYTLVISLGLIMIVTAPSVHMCKFAWIFHDRRRSLLVYEGRLSALDESSAGCLGDGARRRERNRAVL